MTSELVEQLESFITDTGELYTRIAEAYPRMLQEFDAGLRESDRQISLIAAEGGNGLDALHTIMGRTRTCIQEAYDSFSALSRDDSRSLDLLKESIQRLDTLDELIGRITFQTEEIELISLNAMVVALKAGHEGGGFSHITDELRRISARTITQATSLNTEGVQIKAYFDDVRSSAARIAAEQETIFARFRERLSNNSTTIEERLTSVVDFFKTLRGRACGIRDPLMEMTECIQNQDIIRQTIEQIITALKDAPPVESGATGISEEERLDELSFLEQVSRLGASLLDEIAAKIRRNSEAFHTNVAAIRRSVEGIEEERDGFIAEQIEGTVNDGIHDLFRRSEEELNGILKDARRVPKLKQFMRTTNARFVSRIEALEEGFVKFASLVGRYRNIHVAARIEVAKRKILASMETTVEEMRTLTTSINEEVEQALETTREFLGRTGDALEGFKESYQRENELVVAFSSEIRRLYGRLRDTNDEIVQTMRNFNLFSRRFRELGEATQLDDEELKKIEDKARAVGETFAATAQSAAKRRQEILVRRGSTDWEIRQRRLLEIMERLAIYARKARAGEIGGFDVEEGHTEDEVTFF